MICFQCPAGTGSTAFGAAIRRPWNRIEPLSQPSADSSPFRGAESLSHGFAVPAPFHKGATGGHRGPPLQKPTRPRKTNETRKTTVTRRRGRPLCRPADDRRTYGGHPHPPPAGAPSPWEGEGYIRSHATAPGPLAFPSSGPSGHLPPGEGLGDGGTESFRHGFAVPPSPRGRL